MSNAFSIGLGALNASAAALTSVGNNLANMNTTGYKATTVSFYDLVSQQLGVGANSSQIGMGVATPLIRHQFTQGAVASATGGLNAAISGEGFFVVHDSAGNTAYTRGDFKLDANGNLTDSTGKMVQGWNAAAGVLNTNATTTNVVIPAGSLQTPLPTAHMAVNVNLNAAAAVNDKFSTPIQVVDSLGTTHTLTVQLTKTANNAWSYDVFIPGEDVVGGVLGTPQSVATSAGLTFDPLTGKLLTPAPPAAVTVTMPSLKSGAGAQTINWNLYNADLSGTITQFAQTSAASGSSQDGLVSAQPVKIGFADNGIIVAQYANGKTLNVAQVALASIRNPDSLIPIGDNDFQVGSATVTPTIGTAGTGGRGKISGDSLEGSTVDIATEFTNLMVYQRSYQANSKIITTMDELSQDTINLKR